MNNYTGVSPTIFDEPEYRDQTELNLAIYLIVKSDMIGVCPIIISHVAKACRTSPAKVRQTLLYFEKIGKLKIGEQKVDRRRSYPLPFGTHVCWYSKAYHSLRKGRASVKQQSIVSHLTVKWQLSGVFGQKFADALSQLYATKYKIDISIKQHSPSEDEYEDKDKYDNEDKHDLMSPGKPPFEKLRNLYIEICRGFPEPTEVSDWSPKRRGNVNARWKAHPDIDWWRIYFERIAASDFLRNGTDSFRADFGWVMLPSNMEKILEGRYDNKKRKAEKKHDRPTGEFN